ncbi:MAG TPA: DNA-processing protein DprA [Acidimicrobiales bacterium]|nr:DNA-processing protein DprA [Acidimicrobiales bacterium]
MTADGACHDRTLPEAAYAAALAGLPDVGPTRLRRLLDGAEPSQAWARVLASHPLDTGRRWRAVAQRTDVAGNWSTMGRLGIGVLVLGGPRYPVALESDPGAPAVLFHLGDPTVIDDMPRVGIVGTRTATRYGLGVAAQLGAELAATGVAVVSGLALGVDSAAHEGAVAGWESGRPTSAPPVAVVAGGLDSPYPKAGARLWERVAGTGVVLSESPIGTGLERWRFPKRNRILAALSEVLIVVECHQQGGSLHTVRAAMSRGISVGAVPGSIRSPASAGTNDLLADGCFPVRDVTDVMVALGLARAGLSPVRQRRPRGRSETRARTRDAAGGERGSGTPAGDSRPIGAIAAASAGEAERPCGRVGVHETASGWLLDAIGWERCSVDQILRRTGCSLAEVSVELERLAARGDLRSDGAWWERV